MRSAAGTRAMGIEENSYAAVMNMRRLAAAAAANVVRQEVFPFAYAAWFAVVFMPRRIKPEACAATIDVVDRGGGNPHNAPNI